MSGSEGAAMSDVTIKRIEELEFYDGPHKREDIRFCYAGKGLGVSAWGMNVLVLGPNCTSYPEHDHAGDGQEEVYVVLRGRARLRTGDREQMMEAGAMVRVGPSQKRSFFTDQEGATLLAIGATPGQAYQPR